MGLNSLNRVAIIGAFDVENFGDLLFPEIFRQALSRRGINCELALFAPTNNLPRMSGTSTEVFAISGLEDLHEREPIDAVIIGGGALIQTHKLFQIFADSPELQEYRIADTWIAPTMFAVRNQIPIVWNAPDVPYVFQPGERETVKSLVEASAYIAVRNDSSAANLRQLNISEEIEVVPDTGFMMQTIFDSTNLDERKHTHFTIHLNRFLPDEDLDGFARLIESFSKRSGLTPVLVELSATHRDSEALQKLKNKMSVHSEMICGATLSEIFQAIGNSSLFIGVSYHGLISAIIQNVPAVAFNYMSYGKTFDLAHQVGMMSQYCENTADLAQILLRNSRLQPVETEVLNVLKREVEEHFTRLIDVLSSQKGQRRLDLDSAIISDVSEIAKETTQRQLEVASLGDSVGQLSKQLNETHTSLQSALLSLRNEYLAYREFSDTKLAWLEKQINSFQSRPFDP